MRYTYDDYMDGQCTKDEYRSQFNPPTLEVGKIYVQAKGTWHEKHWQILMIDGKIAFAKCVYNKIGEQFTLDYEIFNLNGWVFNDSRLLYRLTEEVSK